MKVAAAFQVLRTEVVRMKVAVHLEGETAFQTSEVRMKVAAHWDCRLERTWGTFLDLEVA